MTERRVPLSLLRSPCWDPLCDWYRAHSPFLDGAFRLARLPQDWQGYVRPLPGAALEGPAPLRWPSPPVALGSARSSEARGSEIPQAVNGWLVPGRPPLRAQELTVKTNDCVVAITRKHGERQEEQGYTSRCLTRKYTLLHIPSPTPLPFETLSSFPGAHSLSLFVSFSDPCPLQFFLHSPFVLCSIPSVPHMSETR
uniref:Uncharacterized protein n=1 Tax=Neovison vison TaxID=452646 RepID=A0A8C7C2W3_NEOVI